MALPPIVLGQHRTRPVACASVELPTVAAKLSTELPAHQEVVLDREEDSRGAGRNTDLVVDMLHVVLGGTTGDPEAATDLGVRASFHDKPQDLDLAVAQPARTEVLTPSRREVARVEDGGNNLTVKSAGTRLAEEFVSRVRRVQRCTMRAALSHRVKGVRATQDASGDINVVAPTRTVVTRAVDSLVMHPGNTRHWVQRCRRRKDAL
jgi:hypothetical protein